MVLNEPLVFTGAGHFLGHHAPGRRGFSNFIPAMLHAALCTGAGERILRSFGHGLNIGSTYSCSMVTPRTNSGADLRATKKADALLNRLFIEPAMGLGFPLQDLPVLSRVEKLMRPEDEANLKANLDFIGIQNYTREVVEACWYVPYLKARLVSARKRGVPYTQMNWEVYPPAIGHMLSQFAAYNPALPLIVTENGAAFEDDLPVKEILHDPLRKAYIQSHIQEVLHAQKTGINVRGYFVWTLLDNFEWAEGYRPRFGLVHVDFETQRRTLKQSGLWYSEFMNGGQKLNTSPG